ncbi:hypothetical protein [Halomicrobium katesii]|uniref:hypothetical protein n=1 Tax=Halomicrobium katesii TaxID=437163 RepID=UPI000365391D|nr:hypothetical protein [Halomicrobium katesii]
MSDEEPAAESACYHVADWRTAPLDTSRRHQRDLCPLCFPDGEIHDCVTHYVYGRGGTRLHRSIDQGGEAETPSGQSCEHDSRTYILQREDVTTIEEARRIAGGDA